MIFLLQLLCRIYLCATIYIPEGGGFQPTLPGGNIRDRDH